MLDTFVHFIVDLVHQWGYLGIFIMTFLESTFVPIPSEVTMVPAGYLVHQGKMDFLTVLACSIVGTVGGSLFNYWVARALGRRFFLRYGHYVLVPPHKLTKIEEYFAEHGEISTFTGRLIPGVRHVISFPAGLANMNLKKFCIFTAIGGAIWMAVLLGVGYEIGDHENEIRKVLKLVTGVVVFAAGGLVLAYVVWKRQMKKKRKAAIKAEAAEVAESLENDHPL